MSAGTSWRYDCSCFGVRQTGQKEHIRGGASGKTRERKNKAVDCKAQFMAYAGISKPIHGGGSGKMVDATLVVCKFEHKHASHSHVERKGKKTKRDWVIENVG